MSIKNLTILCIATTALMSTNASAQINGNRALMERLDRMETDMGLIQRQISRDSVGRSFNQPSTDADSAPILTGNISGDLLQQVTALQEEMRYLRGDVEKNNFEIDRLKEQMKRMQADVDFRLKSIESSPVKEPMNGSPTSSHDGYPMNDDGVHSLKKNDAYKPPRGPATPGEPSSSGSGVLSKPGTHYSDEPRNHYNEAFRLLNQNRYEDAEGAFTKFTQKYGEDPLIGNAFYWLGETYYIRKNYDQAADNFRQGYQALPDGPKAPDNLLKLAMTLKALDRVSDACTIIEQIDKKFKDASSNLLQRAKSEKKLMGCP